MYVCITRRHGSMQTVHGADYVCPQARRSLQGVPCSGLVTRPHPLSPDLIWTLRPLARFTSSLVRIITAYCTVMASRESRSASTDDVPANKRRRKDQCEGSATLDASTDVQGSTVSPPRSALNAAPSTPTPLSSSPRPLPSSAPSPPSVSGRLTNEH